MGVRRRPAVMIVIAALVALPTQRVAGVDVGPAGGEFQVNSYTTNNQDRPSVSSDAAGNFVAVWESVGQDGDGFGVFGQRFSSSGARLGREYLVNSYTRSDQHEPAVASDSVGDFVVVWSSYYQDDGNEGVFGQLFASSGARLESEFQVNTYTIGFQDHAAVARDAAGNFVVVWGSDGQDDDDAGVFGQRFDSSGNPLGIEFMVNSFTPNHQNYPAVAVDMMGDFVVAWQSLSQDGQGWGIFGQRFASSGAPLGTEFQINTYITSNQTAPAVGSDAVGNFVVVWQSAGQEGSVSGVFAQRFANDGDPLGIEFQVNTQTIAGQSAPSVFGDKGGAFVVVWESIGADGSALAVIGQRFEPSGAKIGGEFQINTFTEGPQFRSAIAGTTGKFVVVWASGDQDGSGFGMFGQRFALPGGFAPAPALSHGLLWLMGAMLAAFGLLRLRRRPHRDAPRA